jgi:hypothetical protein
MQDERSDPPAVPPAFAAPRGRRALAAALTGGSRAGSPAAHGLYDIRGSPLGFQPLTQLSETPNQMSRVPIDAFDLVPPDDACGAVHRSSRSQGWLMPLSVRSRYFPRAARSKAR